MKGLLLHVLGFAALLAGAIGLVLPVLPTVPFVLCAAGCFGAANPAIYRKLSKSKYFGEYIRNYRERTGISAAVRVRSIVFLWLSLSVSCAAIKNPSVRIILAIVGIAVCVHILMIKRKR